MTDRCPRCGSEDLDNPLLASLIWLSSPAAAETWTELAANHKLGHHCGRYVIVHIGGDSIWTSQIPGRTGPTDLLEGLDKANWVCWINEPAVVTP